MTLLLALACAAPEVVGPPATATDVPCDDTDETRVVVVRSMTFGRRVDGVSPGFDLDGRVSDDDDAGGCYQEDLVDPSGAPGIDNAFSALLPILEATEGAAIHGLVQDAIDSGALLVLFELEDVDDITDDACVNLDVLHGVGTPRLGTDGRLLSGQTFDRDPDVPASRADGLALVDGTVEARGLDLTLPIQVFDLAFELELHDVALSLTLDPLGGATGTLGGSFAIEQIVEIIAGRSDIAIADLAIEMLHQYADIYPDATGACPDLSLVLELEATSAFVFPDPPPGDGDTGSTGVEDTGANGAEAPVTAEHPYQPVHAQKANSGA